jgi:DNA-binding response OmpR family regulator
MRIKEKILLMEDDNDLGETLQELLESKGYGVTLVNNGIEASEVSYKKKFDLYVFDINVPKFNGLELLDALRHAKDKTPTIFISAFIDLETMTRAFKLGADDYIKKPFFPEELLLRIEAKLKREEDIILYGNLIFNPSNEEVLIEGEVLNLSKMQMALFKIFIHNINQKLIKEDIMEITNIRSESALRVAITKLRNSTGLNIQNLHGIGYRLETY